MTLLTLTDRGGGGGGAKSASCRKYKDNKLCIDFRKFGTLVYISDYVPKEYGKCITK